MHGKDYWDFDLFSYNDEDFIFNSSDKERRTIYENQEYMTMCHRILGQYKQIITIIASVWQCATEF